MAKKAVKKKASPLKGRMRTPPFEAYPEWSQAKFFSFIRSALRAKQIRWAPRNLCKQKAKRIYIGDNPRQKYEYQCNHCKEWFPDKMVELNHKVECGSLKDFDDLPGFVERMFCGEDGYEVTCKKCHLEETSRQREENKKNKE